METQTTTEATTFAQNLVSIADLMWYDGPLLSHYRDGDQDYLIVWTDVDDQFQYWHAVRVSRPDLLAYLENRITLLQVEERSPAIFECRGRGSRKV